MKPDIQTFPSAKVTAIIPTYRRPGLLARAITSVAMQTFSDVRISVYDNASHDETADIVKVLAQADSRIVYACHEGNIGGVQNFEFGLRHVETPYFSFLSDDDLLLPGFYERALAEFSRYPAALFVVGAVLEQSVQGDVLTAGRRTAGIQPGYYQAPQGLSLFIQNDVPIWTGILFRREVIEVVGGLDPQSSNPDEDFLLRCGALCNFALFHEPSAIFCHTQGSMSRSHDTDAERRHYRALTPKLAELAQQTGEENLIPMWNRAINQRLARASLLDIARGHRDRVIGKLEIMLGHPCPGPWAPSLRLLISATSMRPAFRMASLLARGIREIRYEMLRVTSRKLALRYRPMLQTIEIATAQRVAPPAMCDSQ